MVWSELDTGRSSYEGMHILCYARSGQGRWRANCERSPCRAPVAQNRASRPPCPHNVRKSTHVLFFAPFFSPQLCFFSRIMHTTLVILIQPILLVLAHPFITLARVPLLSAPVEPLSSGRAPQPRGARLALRLTCR